MEPRIGRVQLGDIGAVTFDVGSRSWAVILPGAGYSVQAPLLWYARRAVLMAGRNVVAITDAFDRDGDDPAAWVAERATAALKHVGARDARPLIVAKSISTLAAPVAATEALPAVWLTPLTAPGSPAASHVVPGLRAATQPRLLIAGSADPAWDVGVAASLGNAEVLEFAGANHSLELPDDVAGSLDNLRRASDAIHRFVSRLS